MNRYPAFGISLSVWRKAVLLLLFASMLWLSNGCSILRAGAFVNDVPFSATEEDLCGVNALQMVLDYYKVQFDPAWLKSEVNIPYLKGSTPALIAETACKLGLAGAVEKGDINTLTEWVEDGLVPIIYLGGRETGDRGHFVVVTGISKDKRKVRIHGVIKPDEWYKYSQFEENWKAGEYTAVIVVDADLSDM